MSLIKKKSSRERSYTRDELIVHPLTIGISSILRLSQKKLTTSEIYNRLKKNPKIMKHYPDKKRSDGTVLKGLNRNTVLDHLNEMYKQKFVTKEIIKNNIAIWKLTEKISFENYIKEEDKLLIDYLSKKTQTRIFDNLGINIYGFPNEDFFKIDEELEKHCNEKVIRAVKKIKEGMNEIQYARLKKIIFYQYKIYNNLILKLNQFPDKIPILDRRILAILIYYSMVNQNFLNLNDVDNVSNYIFKKEPLCIKIPGFEIKNGKIIITNPHPYLIKILKNNFKEYKYKTDKEMISILKGYNISESLSYFFIYASNKVYIWERTTPIITIARSENIFNIITRSATLTEILHECDSLKFNKKDAEKKLFDTLGEELLHENNNSFLEQSKTFSKKDGDKCPKCKKETIPIKNINDFLQSYMPWLT